VAVILLETEFGFAFKYFITAYLCLGFCGFGDGFFCC